MFARSSQRHRLRLAVLLCWVAVSLGFGAVLPTGVAQADCTGAGDVGAASGCPPPGGGSGSGSNDWPPTAVDWPPSQDSDSSDSGSGSADAAKTPIVMPDGQSPPAKSSTDSGSTSTSTPPTPIVPVGAAPIEPPSPSAIVTPLGSTP